MNSGGFTDFSPVSVFVINYSFYSKVYLMIFRLFNMFFSSKKLKISIEYKWLFVYILLMLDFEK